MRDRVWWLIASGALLIAGCGDTTRPKSPDSFGTPSETGTLIGSWKRQTSKCSFTYTYKADGTYTVDSADGGRLEGVWSVADKVYSNTAKGGVESESCVGVIKDVPYKRKLQFWNEGTTVSFTDYDFNGTFSVGPYSTNINLTKLDSTEEEPTLYGRWIAYNSVCAEGQRAGGIEMHADKTWSWWGNGASYTGHYEIVGTTLRLTVEAGEGPGCVAVSPGKTADFENFEITPYSVALTRP